MLGYLSRYCRALVCPSHCPYPVPRHTTRFSSKWESLCSCSVVIDMPWSVSTTEASMTAFRARAVYQVTHCGSHLMGWKAQGRLQDCGFKPFGMRGEKPELLVSLDGVDGQQAAQ